MIRKILILALLPVLTLSLLGEIKKKNSSIPSSNNYERKVQAKIVMTIRDDGDSFYFKQPWNLKNGPNGFIHLLDADQFLRFTPDGKFVHNFFKKGQGPTEMVWTANYIFQGPNTILAFDRNQRKLLRFQKDGKFLSETRTCPAVEVLHQKGETVYFVTTEMGKPRTRKPNECPYFFKIISYDLSTRKIEELFSFPVLKYVLDTPDYKWSTDIEKFMYAHLKNDLFFVSHSSEYRIKLVDLSRRKILVEFDREYERVEVTKNNKKFIRSGLVVIKGKRYEPPTPKFLNDIQCIKAVNGKLWVFTSTYETDKGVLVDVFDGNGTYTDSFFLKLAYPDAHILEQPQVFLEDGFFFHIEKNADDDHVVNKYKLS